MKCFVNGTLSSAQQSWMNKSLTSSFFVLHQNLQLQQPPGNIRVIAHHRQSCLKLSFHTELYTPICYTKTHPSKDAKNILSIPIQ